MCDEAPENRGFVIFANFAARTATACLLFLQRRPLSATTQMELHRPISATLAAPTDGIPMPRRLGAILAVAFGVSLSVLDGSIANVALPTIGRELGISPADSIWIVNAYQLADRKSVV